MYKILAYRRSKWYKTRLMIRFGPSGNDIAFYAQGRKSSIDAPKWLAEMGLSAYEVNFGRGIKMGEKMAKELGEQARKYNIAVSYHTPYYINLASSEFSTIEKSYYYISKCLEIAKIIDASQGPARLVIHVGSQCSLSRDVAIANCKKNLKWVLQQLDEEGYDDYLLGIETMGRYKAIGSYKEICDICEIDKRVVPVLDFGHINCLTQGAIQRNPGMMRDILQHCINVLGFERMRHVHIHFSAVEYTDKGERTHSVLDHPKWSFPFEPLGKAIKEKGLEPTIICESKKIMAQDAKCLYDRWCQLDEKA